MRPNVSPIRTEIRISFCIESGFIIQEDADFQNAKPIETCTFGSVTMMVGGGLY